MPKRSKPAPSTPGEHARAVITDLTKGIGFMGPDAKADMTKAMSAIILNIHLAKITDADSEASVRNKTLAANILADLTAAQFEANFDINYALWRSYLTQR